jgi:hypothetical protein
MSKKNHKKIKKVSNKFALVDGQPMGYATQWFLIGAVAATAAIKIIEASVTLSLQTTLANPGFSSSNFWISLIG